MAKTQSTRSLVRQAPAHILKDRVIQRLTEAEQALSIAVGVDQVKLVLDVAAAQEVFGRRQKLGEEIIGYAHQIKIHALARLGDLLEAMPKAKGGQPYQKGRRSTGSVLVPVGTLADLGLDKKTASIAQQLAILPAATREAIAQQEITLSQARRERKAEEVRKAVVLPDAKFRVLYADPPWAYNDKADEGAVQAGGAARHYPTMSIAQLCALDVKSRCEDGAVLFMWVTSPLLFESADVIKAWGFSYRASFVWDKVKHNMGHYNSVRHEFLLICVRGSCQPDVVKLFDSVVSEERTAHSVKPAIFRHMIDTLYPHGKRLELFARESTPGWDSFGFEAPNVERAP